MPYKKNAHKVSVIMGIFNCAATLPAALDSLIGQTFSDWEAILCDDASTDETYDIARKYVETYENILLIKNERNIGLAATLNHCLEYAGSEYIARMDGDDLSLPNRFQLQTDYLNTHPEFAFVSGQMINFDENGDWGIQSNPECPQVRDFIFRSPFIHGTVMMRRDALNNVGNYSVKSYLRYGQDYFLWHKFFLAGYRGYNIPIPIYKMRDDRNATNRRNFKSRLQGIKSQWIIFRDLKISHIYDYRLLRPIFVGLLPKSLYEFLHKRKIRMESRIFSDYRVIKKP